MATLHVNLASPEKAQLLADRVTSEPVPGAVSLVAFLGASFVVGADVVPVVVPFEDFAGVGGLVVAGGDASVFGAAGGVLEAGDGELPMKAPVTCAVTLLMADVTLFVIALAMESTESAQAP